jgi:hypothetical protein
MHPYQEIKVYCSLYIIPEVILLKIMGMEISTLIIYQNY